MPRVALTRRVRLAAAHRYWRPEWTPERNRAVFGPCANEPGHGHTYTVEVTVAGEVDEVTGFVVDLGWLDAVLREEVLEPLDHQHLNVAVPEFAPGRAVPTTENLVLYLWGRLARRLGERLVRLRVYEADDLYAELPAPSSSSSATASSPSAHAGKRRPKTRSTRPPSSAE